MTLSVPFFLLLAVAAQAPDAGGAAPAAAIVPLLGAETTAVIHVDLTRLDAPAFLRNVVGELADEEDVARTAKAIGGWVEMLRRAQVKDLFVLIDPADFAGPPVLAAPLSAGVDGRAVGAALTSGGLGVPGRWPASETIRGAQVAGTPAALARLRAAQPVPRPDVAAAFAEARPGVIQLVLVPSATQRRVLEESLPQLPAELGGQPIATLTRGFRWASLALAAEPKPTLHAVVQASDADAAQTLRTLVQNAFKHLPQRNAADPASVDLGKVLGELAPTVKDDRLTLEVDLSKIAALAAVPLKKARGSALRAQSINNLKQIGLAMHNYHAAYNSFPPAYTTSPEGKPLLSWRVLLLPYLEQADLYQQFKRDEPWDSPHNKALLSKMPPMFANPNGSTKLARGGRTAYLVPRGPATIFPGAQPVKLQEITDGTSNTIFVVEANDEAAVPWTKPEDWEVPAAPTIKSLTRPDADGTVVGFADGSVRTFKTTLSPKQFLHLLTRNGGEVVTPYEDH